MSCFMNPTIYIVCRSHMYQLIWMKYYGKILSLTVRMRKNL